jgi:DNA-binding CsgD family transcriptional regulator
VSAPVPVLTDRQVQLLTLAAAGHTSIEIGRMLFLSPATIKNHFVDAYYRLGARDRTQAVLIAYRAGLLPDIGQDTIGPAEARARTAEAALRRVAALQPCATIHGHRLIDLDDVLAAVAGPDTARSAA